MFSTLVWPSTKLVVAGREVTWSTAPIVFVLPLQLKTDNEAAMGELTWSSRTLLGMQVGVPSGTRTAMGSEGGLALVGLAVGPSLVPALLPLRLVPLSLTETVSPLWWVVLVMELEQEAAEGEGTGREGESEGGRGGGKGRWENLPTSPTSRCRLSWQ